MSKIAVLGGGAGGQSAAVELTSAGHVVNLWNRRESTIKPVIDSGTIRFTGVLGEGEIAPKLVTTDLAQAISDAEIIVVVLPSVAHGRLFEDLARLGVQQPVILNPGHTGGALHARQIWSRLGQWLPPLVEFSTLTYVARVSDDNVVRTTGRARMVKAAQLPGGRTALDAAFELFPGAQEVENVLASSLSNVNLVLHPPGAILGLSWAEHSGGGFTFYVDGVTAGVGRVIEALDSERLSVAKAFGVDVVPLLDEMLALGTADPQAVDLASAIRGGEANKTIGAPDSLNHRYYREDFPFGVLPFISLAALAGVDVPVAKSLMTLATTAAGPALLEGGLGAEALGLTSATTETLKASIAV
jgi:opine dehydrogenase